MIINSQTEPKSCRGECERFCVFTWLCRTIRHSLNTLAHNVRIIFISKLLFIRLSSNAKASYVHFLWITIYLLRQTVGRNARASEGKTNMKCNIWSGRRRTQHNNELKWFSRLKSTLALSLHTLSVSACSFFLSCAVGALVVCRMAEGNTRITLSILDCPDTKWKIAIEHQERETDWVSEWVTVCVRVEN